MGRMGDRVTGPKRKSRPPGRLHNSIRRSVNYAAFFRASAS
jgi:hypothetical protein